MAPKKAKKIPLNEFLGDSALGSWADEMDSLPSAPAARNEEDQGRHFDRYPRRDDFSSNRPERPPAHDVPLPTQPPYTAFIGNLSFDLIESELEEFFSPSKTKSVKIIRDREDKPKGFGYIEFEELAGLKDALSKSGSNLSGRVIRVSVAEPPKERTGFSSGGGASQGFEDEAKFDNPWRREGPLPDHGHSREPSRRRFDGPPPGDRALPSVAEDVTDWRASRPARPPVSEDPPVQRKSGFSTPEAQAGASDQAEVWTRGNRVSSTGPSEEKHGNFRNKADTSGPSAADEVDWRAGKPKPSASPNSSTPPTPQMSRRKLELLPRSGNASTTQTPLSSPKMASANASAPPAARSNPFGAARPVDVTSREKEVAERLEKERDVTKERLTISRTNSRQPTERGARTPPTSASATTPKSASATAPAQPKPALGPSVRPSLSFASAAAAKKASESSGSDTNVEKKAEPQNDVKGYQDEVEKNTENVSELTA